MPAFAWRIDKVCGAGGCLAPATHIVKNWRGHSMGARCEKHAIQYVHQLNEIDADR